MAKILVIDDAEETLDLVEQVLGQEHDILTLSSWVNVAHYVYHHAPDLILMDVNMPGLAGDTLTKVLMKNVKEKALSIVLFSSIDEDELQRKAQQVNARGYISKTFDADLLRSHIRRFLN